MVAKKTDVSETYADPLVIKRSAEILYGAIRVIARDGVVAAKLKDIAREAGVSLGLVQHYFDTRDRLVDEAFRVMMLMIAREGKQRMRAYDDPLWSLYALNRLHVYGTVDFPERWGFWTELWATSGRSQQMRKSAAQVYGLWKVPIESALESLAEEGRLPELVQTGQATAALMALMDGLAIRALAEPEMYTPEVMLSILDDWVSLQLHVPALLKDEIVQSLDTEGAFGSPKLLSPELLAGALTETHNGLK